MADPVFYPRIGISKQHSCP